MDAQRDHVSDFDAAMHGLDRLISTISLRRDQAVTAGLKNEYLDAESELLILLAHMRAVKLIVQKTGNLQEAEEGRISMSNELLEIALQSIASYTEALVIED
ncbi:hypothetical protein V0242_24825 (plasmid) [Aeromonas hydrophila]|uniref:hypothetical protein n=1 Tax=Aeromonas hydrophila TaxID=644 RepID=UPI002ED39836|nr:hypothetical protein V0242_24825 [Aeromonas hydrophila]